MARVAKRTPTRLQLHSESAGIPNNPTLPTLVYSNILEATSSDTASILEALFEKNSWSETWRNGVYPYHHYHSCTHETLGIASGAATIQLGGPGGSEVDVSIGDVIVLPSGVGHKRLESSHDFLVVGAYPNGSPYDLISIDSPSAESPLAAIESTPLPLFDPIYGASGPLCMLWATAR